jgi:hypothetical protein
VRLARHTRRLVHVPKVSDLLLRLDRVEKTASAFELTVLNELASHHRERSKPF